MITMQNSYTDYKNFLLNGFVITMQEPQNYIMAKFRYRGVAYGRAWPLKEISLDKMTSEDVELTSRVQEMIMSRPYIGDSYPLGVVPDFRLVQRYYRRCISVGIRVRILLIATPYRSPVVDEMMTKNLDQSLSLLGYDYVSSDFSYSAVVDDLNPPFSPSVTSLVSRMNKYGLFGDVSSLAEYVAARWEFVQSHKDHMEDHNGVAVRVSALEDDVELVPCQVHEIKGLA
jgi:hypothetical protein